MHVAKWPHPLLIVPHPLLTMATSPYICRYCSFRCSTKKDILRHLSECHINDPGFCMKCLLCGRSFRVFSSFTSHVSHSHPGVSTENAYNCEAVCLETGDFESDMDEVTSHKPSTGHVWIQMIMVFLIYKCLLPISLLDRKKSIWYGLSNKWFFIMISN